MGDRNSSISTECYDFIDWRRGGSEVVHWERKRLREKSRVSLFLIVFLFPSWSFATRLSPLLLPRIHAMTDDGLWNHRWKGRKGQWKEKKVGEGRENKSVLWKYSRDDGSSHLSWTYLNRLRKRWFPMVISSMKRTLTDERNQSLLSFIPLSSVSSLTCSFHSEQQKKVLTKREKWV